jgi:hypothetical protein
MRNGLPSSVIVGANLTEDDLHLIAALSFTAVELARTALKHEGEPYVALTTRLLRGTGVGPDGG